MSGWGGSKFTVAVDITEPAERDEEAAQSDDEQVRPEAAHYSTLDQSQTAAPVPRERASGAWVK